MAYQLSDNGLKLGIEALKTIAVVAGLLAPIWIQSHLQHIERMAEAKSATQENNERLDKIASEVKATARPLVYGAKE